MIYQTFKKCAFSLDAEKAHNLSMQLLSRFPGTLSKVFHQEIDYTKNKRYQIELGPDLKWPYPVGLAAGLDKNAEAISFFSRLYLGAIEVGTVTPMAQPGNKKPRLFRYPELEGLRNCLGFNNHGMEAMKANLRTAKLNGRALGVNLGKNKSTPQDKAYEDYQKLYHQFAGVADYLVVNISSPNTPGLRDLQAKEGLEQILGGLSALRKEQPCPLFVKIAPDLNFDDVSTLLDVAQAHKLQGVIATNTTRIPEWGEGGVSGRPLLEKSRAMREFVLKEIESLPDFHCIGVGGISSFEDIWDFWKAGGKAVQVYSAFIYQGPALFEEFKNGIDHKLKAYGLETVEDLLKNIKDLK